MSRGAILHIPDIPRIDVNDMFHGPALYATTNDDRQAYYPNTSFESDTTTFLISDSPSMPTPRPSFVLVF